MDIMTPTHNELDLLDKHSIAEYMACNNPDMVIHLAAKCGGIGVNREKPGEFLYDNLMMTTNLIESCRHETVSLVRSCHPDGSYRRHHPIKKFVGIGTVCSYPRNTPVPFREKDLFNGYPEETNAPYGIAKRVQLEMLKAYRAQYGFNGIFLIPVNLFGEHDNFDDDSSHVIPAMLKKFHRAKLAGDPFVTLWGDGSASREFLYVGDCAEAILQATLHYDNPDPVNIGTGKEITIRDLAHTIKDVVGYEGEIRWDTSKPNGQPRRQLDVSRAKERFGFEAKSNFRSTLINTYKWAQENGVL
jgi:GDP-L-fucose synthase